MADIKLKTLKFPNSENTYTIPQTAEEVGAAPAIESQEYPGCYYRIVNGAMEWLNPPMILNQEYRTTERWNGKPVYKKCVDCGKLPNNTEKSVNHNISGVSTFLSVRLVAGISGGTQIELVKCEGDSVKVNSTQVIVKTLWNASEFQSYAFLEYVKN